MYILYSPSFNTISDKPNYGSTGSSGTSASLSTRRSRPVGAIVGGVIGGTAALLVGFFVTLCRKRLFNRHSSSPVAPATTQSCIIFFAFLISILAEGLMHS